MLIFCCNIGSGFKVFNFTFNKFPFSTKFIFFVRRATTTQENYFCYIQGSAAHNYYLRTKWKRFLQSRSKAWHLLTYCWTWQRIYFRNCSVKKSVALLLPLNQHFIWWSSPTLVYIDQLSNISGKSWKHLTIIPNYRSQM